MACACKNSKKTSQPKQINKASSKSISPRTSPRTIQRSSSAQRIIKRRTI